MYIVFDIGGTNIRIARSRDMRTFDEPLVVPTPQSFEEGVTKLIELSQSLAQGEAVTAMAGGVPGPLSAEKTALVGAPHLTDWVGKPLIPRLRSALSAPVHLENDAALVGLGEAHAGAGMGYKIVAYLTISTGVGGTRIVQGKIDPSSKGYEPGHQIIDHDKSACPECSSGSLEAYVSGSGLESRLHQKPTEVTDLLIWKQLAHWLAIGVANSILHWTPDVVILGGAMMFKRPGIDIADVAGELKEILTIYPEVPPLVQATLKDTGGLHGGLALLRQAEVGRTGI